MTSFLHLNVQDYVLVCICCTSQSAVLIKLSSCEHTGFLENYINLKVPILKINKLYNLERSTMEIDVITFSEIEVEIKPEPMEAESSDVDSLATNVKLEKESTEMETERQTQLQKKKNRDAIKAQNELRKVQNDSNMAAAKLIATVQEYEEIYNLYHHNYTNQQRRDNIWEEIGSRLNQNGTACKERWTRIRDNHRKALNLRKTKIGEAASKLKPPKYSQELSFLAPYLHDEEERRPNLSPRIVNHRDESQDEALSGSLNLHSPLSIESATITRTVGRKSIFTATQNSTVAEGPQDYSTITCQNLMDFFINMAKTVLTFPLQEQIQIKAHLFEIVNRVEMRLATTRNKPDCNPMASGSSEGRVRLVSNRHTFLIDRRVR